MQDQFDYPWVLIDCNNTMMAVSVLQTQSMVTLPELSAIPNTQNYVRGVMNLRGQIIPVLDLRVRLGLRTHTNEIEDFIKLLSQREQDHLKWLAELEASVKERRAFNLAADPHKCAFGKWYDTYKTSDKFFRQLLDKFDEPHKTIHSIAIKVKEFQDKQQFDRAFAVIEKTRSRELALMCNLFGRCRDYLKDSLREIAVVISSSSGQVALAVDRVVSVEKLNPTSAADIPSLFKDNKNNENLSLGIAVRKNSSELVLILNPDNLHIQTSQAASA